MTNLVWPSTSRRGSPRRRWTRCALVLLDKAEDNLGILRVLNLVQVHLAAVAVVLKPFKRVVHVGDAAGHARGEVAPGGPRITTSPPVMYSHPWSPTPSTTARAPELRTQKRSAATPRKKALPEVAP